MMPRMIPSALLLVVLLIAFSSPSRADIPKEVAESIKRINAKGNYYGLIVSGKAELQAVLAMLELDSDLPTVDASARRFYAGRMLGHRTIVVMSGPGMVNAAQTTQLLVSLFRVGAVLHYGRAASSNPNTLKIGDIAVPRRFAHTGVFYWEKFGGDDRSFDRRIANLTFSKFNVGERLVPNELQSLYNQPEVIFSRFGNPEVGKKTFWMNVDDDLYAIAQKIEKVDLERCVGKSLICLGQKPKIKRVEKGGSANIYVNNEGYRDFLQEKLGVESMDTESAAIAMACQSEKMAFVALRSITNYGGGSAEGNDVEVILKLWPRHANAALNGLFRQLPSLNPKIRTVTDA